MAHSDTDGFSSSEASLFSDETSEPEKYFRFFDLPAELRQKIHEHILLVDHTIDLDPKNYRNIVPLLRLFYTCRHMYEEAYRVFYGRNTFRMFTVNAQFFRTKRPLLTRLPPKYLRELTSLELRLGPGWSKPPKSWTLKPRPRANMRLLEWVKVRNLKVFVECDPSHDIFRGFRINERFYTAFCGQLVGDLIEKVPSIKNVEFDAYPSVSIHAPLMRELLMKVKEANKTIQWGPCRNWDEPGDSKSSTGLLLETNFAIALQVNS